jgi:peptidoglycan/xylan/chitin deacetylase (PgdA/CDA1 family)
MSAAKRSVLRRLRDAALRVAGTSLAPSGRRSRLAIFTYHQVLEHADPLRQGEPDRRQFADDLEVIRSVFSVLPLPEAAERLRAGSLPARAACVTFDDGYANNHQLAMPLLEAAGVPATFFITGGAVDVGVMWNDLVIEAVARAKPDGFDCAGVVDLEPESFGEPRKLVRALLGQLKYRPLAERLAVAEELYRRNAGAAPPRLMMSRAMVADLAARGFDVGGHTLQHPILKELSDADALREIVGCRHWLEQVTSRRPVTFAYPNGRPGTDFLPAHMRMVAECGFTAAVSTRWSVARTGTDPFDLPRVGPWWRQGRSLPLGLLAVYARSYR